MNMRLTKIIQAGVSTALALSVGTAWSGQLTGLSANKTIVKIGEQVNLTAIGTVQCGVMINDGNGQSWPIGLTDPTSRPTKLFGISYDHAGKFHVTATGKGGTGSKDCISNRSMAVDITVLGAPPRCTFDMDVQKDYQAIGVQVKACEVSSTPPVTAVSQPARINAHPSLGVTPINQGASVSDNQGITAAGNKAILSSLKLGETIMPYSNPIFFTFSLNANKPVQNCILEYSADTNDANKRPVSLWSGREFYVGPSPYLSLPFEGYKFADGTLMLNGMPVTKGGAFRITLRAKNIPTNTCVGEVHADFVFLPKP